MDDNGPLQQGLVPRTWRMASRPQHLLSGKSSTPDGVGHHEDRTCSEGGLYVSPKDGGLFALSLVTRTAQQREARKESVVVGFE